MAAFNARESASKPMAPKTSYWVGASRGELRAAIQERRAQQQIPNVSDLTHDPIVEATAELLKRRHTGAFRRGLVAALVCAAAWATPAWAQTCTAYPPAMVEVVWKWCQRRALPEPIHGWDATMAYAWYRDAVRLEMETPRVKTRGKTFARVARVKAELAQSA